MPKGKPYSAEFKARVVLEALQGAKTVNELAAEHDLNPNLVRNWKAKAESGLSRSFSAAEDERTLEGDDRELAMRVIDEVHLETPYGSCRKIREELRRRTEGAIDASRRCVAGLMEEMNVRPVYPRPSLSKPAKRAIGHPYLLKNKAIAELRRLVAAYVEQYNNAGPRQSLGYDTPAEWSYSGLAAALAATLTDVGSLPDQDFVSKRTGHITKPTDNPRFPRSAVT